MDQTAVNKRVRIFDRINGNGLIGRIVSVTGPTSFEFRTNPTTKHPEGKKYTFATEGELAVRIEWLGDV